MIVVEYLVNLHFLHVDDCTLWLTEPNNDAWLILFVKISISIRLPFQLEAESTLQPILLNIVDVYRISFRWGVIIRWVAVEDYDQVVT
jgi:hypothetical protein